MNVFELHALAGLCCARRITKTPRPAPISGRRLRAGLFRGLSLTLGCGRGLQQLSNGFDALIVARRKVEHVERGKILSQCGLVCGESSNENVATGLKNPPGPYQCLRLLQGNEGEIKQVPSGKTRSSMPDFLRDDFRRGFYLNSAAKEFLRHRGIGRQRRRHDEVDFTLDEIELDKSGLLDVIRSQ